MTVAANAVLAVLTAAAISVVTLKPLSVRYAERGVIFNAPEGSLVHAGFSLGLGWALLLFPESLSSLGDITR